jgi:hypothetical protein
MVAVAQLVESRIVIPVVVGSSPISHPKEHAVNKKSYSLRLVALFFVGAAIYALCWMRKYRNTYIIEAMKTLKFIGGSQDDLTNFPLEARRMAGFELWQAQIGAMPSD